MPAPTPPSGRRILVVEDDPNFRQWLREILGRHGWCADFSQDGQEALTRARAGGYALILLDVILPKLGGFHLARLLKFDPRTKATPLVMLTVLDREADRERGREVGVDGYLTKPVSEAELLQEIRRLIGGSGSTSGV